MQARAPTYALVGSTSTELRLMDTDIQTALGDGLAGPDVRREDSRSSWPDAWLINAVRREPPDAAAGDCLPALPADADLTQKTDAAGL